MGQMKRPVVTPDDAIAKFKKYGMPGDPIPGSKLVRAYCHMCWAAMRVSGQTSGVFCQGCFGEERPIPPAHTGLTKRQVLGLRHTSS